MKKIGISYKALPALKICRMAVHKEYTSQGIGTRMVAFAVKIALSINRRIGCRFLTLEAKNAQDLLEYRKPVHFYQKNEFKTIKERKQTSAYIPMYKDLKPMINRLNSNGFRFGTLFD